MMGFIDLHQMVKNAERSRKEYVIRRASAHERSEKYLNQIVTETADKLAGMIEEIPKEDLEHIKFFCFYVHRTEGEMKTQFLSMGHNVNLELKFPWTGYRLREIAIKNIPLKLWKAWKNDPNYKEFVFNKEGEIICCTSFINPNDDRLSLEIKMFSRLGEIYDIKCLEERDDRCLRIYEIKSKDNRQK